MRTEELKLSGLVVEYHGFTTHSIMQAPLDSRNDIPKIPLKSVTKFRIPISTPSQSKLEAIILYKQKKSQTPEIFSTTGKEEAGSQPLSTSSKLAMIKEIQERTHSATETYNNLQKEQENLQRSNRLIKNEIASLNDIQSNLLWLLKKANQYETQRNHSQAGWN